MGSKVIRNNCANKGEPGDVLLCSNNVYVVSGLYIQCTSCSIWGGGGWGSKLLD